MSLQDRINLAIGFGLLPVLSVAMVLAVVGASRAARLSDMQMQFMAGVTHELRTPLPAIRTIGRDRADALDSSGAEVVRYGELIRDYGRPLTEMVEQVLQLSSAGRGRYASSLAQPMSPQRRTKLSRIRLSGEHAGFNLELAHARPLSSVMADPKAPYQSLTKLLSIALEYGRPGGWVKIEAAASENGGRREVQARIRTRGPGVPLSEAPPCLRTLLSRFGRRQVGLARFRVGRESSSGGRRTHGRELNVAKRAGA